MDGGDVSGESAFSYAPLTNSLTLDKLKLTALSTPANTTGLSWGANLVNMYVDNDNGDMYYQISSVTYLTLKTTGTTIENKVHLNDTLFLEYLNLLSGDTVGLIMKGSRCVVDSASISARKGWTDKIDPYWRFYRVSKIKKALPLPYPDGTQRREVNALHRDFQIEYELERLHRYLMRQWIENKVQWIIIVLLGIGFIYQQLQIKKLKKQ